MPDRIEYIPFTYWNEFTPDGIPVTNREEAMPKQRKPKPRRKPLGAAAEAAREHRSQLQAIKDAIGEHISDGGLVTAPDTLANRIHEALFGEG